jgi:osmotically-inducible protein OsmY
MRLLTLAALACAVALTGCNDRSAQASETVHPKSSDALPTPMDQGGSEAELKITQEIRKALVADDTLSVSAENVKVVTQGSVVTLRGPVKTAAEKSKIESVARNVPGVTRVENLLELSPK